MAISIVLIAAFPTAMRVGTMTDPAGMMFVAESRIPAGVMVSCVSANSVDLKSLTVAQRMLPFQYSGTVRLGVPPPVL